MGGPLLGPRTDRVEPEAVDEDIRGPVVADSADEGGHVEQWQAIDAEPLPQTGISHWFDGVTVEEFGTVDGVVGQSMGELDEHEELADTGTREQALLVAGSEDGSGVDVDDLDRPLSRTREVERPGHRQRGAIRRAPSMRIVSPLR